MNAILKTAPDGSMVWVSPEQASTIDTLIVAHGGGFSNVTGYVPSTGYVKSPVINVQILTRFDTVRLYDRRINALNAITFDDVKPFLTAPKLTALSEAEQEDVFNARKAMEVASMMKTIVGDRSDNHRKGHDRCYVTFAKGIKVHLVTEREYYTDADGKSKSRMVPVLTDGYPTADSIMVMHLELNRQVVSEGERKHVNSGAPVLMSKAIKRLLNDRSVGIRALSLKPDNFEKVSISKSVIVPDDVKPLLVEPPKVANMDRFGDDTVDGYGCYPWENPWV